MDGLHRVTRGENHGARVTTNDYDPTMRATRRNVLVILGVLTIAGGALFGTGAFTQVEAQRSVDVQTAGDGSANLGLEVTGELSGGSGDTISFAEDNINLNATTSYDNSFNVTNNGNNPITLDIENPGGTSLINATGQPMYFEGPTTIGTGDTVTYDVVFNTTGVSTIGNANFPDSVTIVANEQ
jgi:hypothetical protein